MNLLATTHFALNTSLGLDFQTAAAASRAGLVKSQEADHYKLGSPTKGEIEKAIIHPLPIITEGFQDQARLGIILQKTAQDICDQLVNDGINLPIELYVSLPHPHRTYTGLPLKNPEPSEEEQELESLLESEKPDETLYAAMIRQSLMNLPWPATPSIKGLFFSGTTGVAECIEAATANLSQAEKPALALVLAIDSMVSIKELTWLHGTGRLKNDDNPVGIQPGEAGAAFTLCNMATAASLPTPPKGYIHSVTTSQEKNTLLKGEQSDGKVLAQLINNSAPSGSEEQPAPVWCISDHNGEEYRAAELGGAMHFLTKYKPNTYIADTWYPAISFGHTEASYGAIAICLAGAAFSRRYAPLPRVHILATSDGPMRSSFVFSQTREDVNNG